MKTPAQPHAQRSDLARYEDLNPARLPETVLAPLSQGACHRWSPLVATGLAVFFTLTALPARANTVAYWRFEPANPAADASGNGHDLVLNGVTTASDVSAAASGTACAVFDGASYAVTATTLDLSKFPGITIECFVKTNGQSTLGMIYEHSTNNNVSVGGFYFDFNETGGQIKTAQGPTPYATKLAKFPYDANWHHYALTIDESGPATVFNLYVDGVLQTPASATTSFSRPFRDDLFFIGSRNGTTFRFNGKVDELRVSSRVLPPSGFLIAPPLTNAVIGILQQPANATVVQNHPATFSVKAALTNADPALLEYQWRTNGVPVPGATAAAFTLPVTPLAYQGVQVSVVVSVPSVAGVTPATSANATLNVQTDTVPPIALAAYAHLKTVTGVLFNEVLDPTVAADPSRYSLDGGATVDSAQILADGVTVVLGVSPLSAPTYTLSYNVPDLAGNWATNRITVTNSGFTAIDIGSAPVGLVITTNATGFTVVGGGADIWTGADGFQFMYKELTGDFDMRLRVNNVVPNYSGTTATSVRGGLMVREDTTPQSRNVYMATYSVANNTWVSTFRATTAGNTIINKGTPLPSRGPNFNFPNAWVRLKRIGQTFTAYYSTNNLDWTQYGTNIVANPPYPDTVMVGVASDSVSAVNTATFQYSDYTQFFLTNGTLVISAQPTNVTVVAYRPATFTVAAGLQGSTDQTLLGYQWLSNGVPVEGGNSPSLTVELPTPSDSGTQFRCLISAPGAAPVSSAAATLTVLPDTTPPVALWAYSLESHVVGIAFDELVNPDVANNPGIYTVDGGFNVLNAQLQADGKTVMLSVDNLTAPQFQVTVTGIADLSGNTTNLTVKGVNAGFTMADINNGFLMPSQLLAVDPNGLTVSAVGTDIWGTQDSFNFVFQMVTNDFDVRLQMAGSSPLRNGSQRGGLMVRLDSTQGSPNVFAGTYAPGAVNNWVVTERPTQDAATLLNVYIEREPTFAFPNAWLRLKRTGQTLSAYESLNGFNWVQLGTNITDLVMPDVVMVGIASVPISTTPANFTYSHFGPTLSLPQLQVQLTGANAVLSWTTNATGFVLQQAGSLSAQGWSTVPGTPAMVGAVYQVTLPVEGGARFFRLAN